MWLLVKLLPLSWERWSPHPSEHWISTSIQWQLDDRRVVDWFGHENNQNVAHIFPQVHSAVFAWTRHSLVKG